MTEIIKRGAFRSSLARDPDIMFLTNHGAGGGLPLARTKSGTLAVTEDATGLHYRAELDDEDHDAQKLVRPIRRGDLDGASFAFKAVRQRWNEDRSLRTLLEVDVDGGDVSAVNRGASPAAYSALARGSLTVAERRAATHELGDRVVVEFRSLSVDRPRGRVFVPSYVDIARAKAAKARLGLRSHPGSDAHTEGDPPHYTDAEVEALGKKGLALKRKNGPGYHYPIQNRRDLAAAAIAAFGRAPASEASLGQGVDQAPGARHGCGGTAPGGLEVCAPEGALRTSRQRRFRIGGGPMNATDRRLVVCSCCGRNDRLTAVPAVERQTGRRTTVTLCEACRANRYRTWRLRYQEQAA